METEDKKFAAPLDAVNTASKWSQVSKKPKNSRAHLYWLAGGTVAVIMVLVMSSNPEPGSHKKKKPSLNGYSFDSSLNVNLAHLRELNVQKPKSNSISNSAEQPLSQRASKETIVRQNAPTSMYSSPITQMAKPSMKRQVGQATFVGHGANNQFANSNITTTSVQATRIPHPSFTIVSGEFLHAILETSINSDLPGMVRAVVSKPSYSYAGERMMIPSGSRLIGQYSSSIIQGQDRVMIIWNRAVLPNGIAVQLNSPGTDALGRAGQGADSVNTHFFARFGESALLSILGAGTAAAGISSTDQYNSASQYRMAIAQSFKQSAQQSLQGSLPMKPTIHIYQGTKINVFVAHDLSFYQALKSTVNLQHPIPNFIK
jgi:type IV secretion system protein VirB10